MERLFKHLKHALHVLNSNEYMQSRGLELEAWRSMASLKAFSSQEYIHHVKKKTAQICSMDHLGKYKLLLRDLKGCIRSFTMYLWNFPRLCWVSKVVFNFTDIFQDVTISIWGRKWMFTNRAIDSWSKRTNFVILSKNHAYIKYLISIFDQLMNLYLLL